MIRVGTAVAQNGLSDSLRERKARPAQSLLCLLYLRSESRLRLLHPILRLSTSLLERAVALGQDLLPVGFARPVYFLPGGLQSGFIFAGLRPGGRRLFARPLDRASRRFLAPLHYLGQRPEEQPFKNHEKRKDENDRGDGSDKKLPKLRKGFAHVVKSLLSEGFSLTYLEQKN